ncbi:MULTISPECIES: hypothetical protein [Rhizobium]|uniref:hypothetical protein n=1 Tax=Rhizobium TaxID=379 RepID=UPI00103AD447|nr:MULTISPECIES: hypothetical protein [Rhizobium]NKK95253.1 hypothetical protein [Rhizobium leguminosarum bv. viciae]TCA74776.1 hypothetical protein E0H74_34405 [Rhizobium leguminosarum bv. viciae]TCA87074.1 hypothetical protein E0H76_34865 [Rhizobium leguminosarum bv. viciae]WSH81015.1 hypothetical protein U8P69_04350 [Rhizobium beringeri]
MTKIDSDYFDSPPLGWLLPRHIDWLIACGVSTAAIVEPEPIRLIHGFRGHDGFFEVDQSGPAWLAFRECEDICFWRPESEELARWTGRAFALGEQAVDNAGTYSIGHCLQVFRTPLCWLKGGRDGIVVIDWERAFDELRHCPRVAVDENLLPVYSRHMRPRRLPEVYVLPERRGVAS